MKTFWLKKVFCIILYRKRRASMLEVKIQSGRTEVHEHIIDVAAEQFRVNGIRSVRMDDIASLVGISKRTLYEEFEDKETLLKAVLVKYKGIMNRELTDICTTSSNTLEIILRIFDYHLRFMRDTNPKYFLDMQRYPDLVAQFHETRQSHQEQARLFIQRGIDEGSFRKDFNVEVFLRMHNSMSDNMKALVADMEFYEVFRSTIMVSLRGISTPMGLKQLDEFLERMDKEIKK